MESILKLYNEKNRKKRPPTPYSIFITIKSDEIYKNTKESKGSRPDLKDMRKAFKDAWDKVTLDDMKIYEEAATALGYVKPSLNLTAKSDFVARRLARLNERLNKK